MELVDLYDENRIPLGRTAEREVWEELGIRLDLGGLRPSVTVNFDGGFDDFYILTLSLQSLTLQEEEVQAVRWAGLEEILGMREKGTFIPYPESFLRFLFDMRKQFGFPSK